MVGMFEYHNASLEGDPRWATASRWTRHAPSLVVVLFALSVIETVLGAVWIAQLQSDMTIPKILQPLILPGLSFFNTLPSLHLHILTRSNPPTLALWFSSIFVVLYLSSTLAYLVSCNMPISSASSTLLRTECWVGISSAVTHGPKQGMWWAVIVLDLFSMLLYGVHASMALKVRRVENKKFQAEVMMIMAEQDDPELGAGTTDPNHPAGTTPAAKRPTPKTIKMARGAFKPTTEEEAAKARERWRELARNGEF